MKKAAIFTDHLVLQANKPIRIFGTGEGTVDVRFDGETKTVTAQNGSWLVELAPRPYGGPFDMYFDLNGEKETVRDVYVGEVLLCSGQSNMSFLLRDEVTPPESYLNNSLVRHFAVARPEEEENPLNDADGWVLCTKEGAGRWSALAYLMGVDLQSRLGCAVGVVLCAQGASVIQTWMTKDSLSEPMFQIPVEQLFIDHVHPPFFWNGVQDLYNRMLTPLIPFSFGAVQWYQGESNASHAECKVYHRMLAVMIELWRKVFMDDTLPFICVKIADTRTDEGWLGIQAAQEEAAMRIAGMKLVRSADVCEKEMIHPVTKGALARRMVDAYLG